MKNLMYFAQHVFGKRIGICLVFSLVLLIGPAEAYESFTTSVEAYQGFTISNGMSTLDSTVITIIIGSAEEISAISAPNIDPLFDFSPPVDILFGLTTDPNHPIEVVAEQIIGLAVLEDTAVENVTDDLLATLDFTARTVTIDSNDIVVLLLNQDQEEYAMLLNITKYPDATVSFTYWKSEIPEVSTLVLLSVGIGFLIGMMKQKQHNRSRKGGRSMKHFKTLLFVLVFVPLLVGTATAAELKVLLIGTGRGFVEGGDDIFCYPDCEETHEQGTVVQLKAFPDDDSTFEGWMVNGKPHEGVITIDQDVILLTARFERNTPLDESTVMWYDGNRKMSATLALDEIAIVPAQKPENPYVLEGEFKLAMEEVARLFHPQARITGWGDFDIMVKSPEPIAKDQLPDMLAAITEHESVRQAAPVLYFNPNVPESQIIPSGTLSVWFPKSYTEDQILALEQEYGLVRWRVSRINSHHIVYEAESPWKAFEIANQLYESGLVEYASPDYSTLGVLHNQLLEVDSFADHWHFRDPAQHGADVIGAWTLNDKKTPSNPIRGSGVVIGIQDDGVEIAHPDLAENIAYDLCFDYVDSWGWGTEIDDKDPTPTKIKTTALAATVPEEELRKLCGGHGTAVTGVAAGKGFNTIGIYGIASEAKIAAYRTSGFKIEDGSIVYPKFPKEKNIGADVLERNRDDVHIYNHSIGHIPEHLTPMDDDVKYQLESGAVGIQEDDIEPGRNRLGNIFVDGAGNEREEKDNTNYDAYTNSRYTIAVAASTKDGTIAPYSTPGANVLVNAPCDGIPTTDRMGEEGYNPWEGSYYYKDTDYYKLFAGTSAAAPVVSGVIALMLQANPELDWRDVQHILIETAEKNPGENWGDDDHMNAAGYSHSYNGGFGRVNAKKAVEAALLWNEDTVPDEREEPVTAKNTDKDKISPNEEIPKEIDMTENIRVEFVEVYLNVEYHHWCLLEVELSSPDGTTSILSPKSSCFADEMYPWEPYGFEYWRFGSVRHFGESSKGTWTLTIRHKGWYDDAEFKRWRLKLYGTELPPYVQAVEARSGDELIYSAEWVVEEDGQLEFVEHVEPQNISNTTPLHLTIVTSEAMQWLSLNLFDKDFSSKERTRKIKKADKTGTLWEVTIDPADFPQDNDGELSDVYTLTLTGQDSGNLYLLPFADRYSKTLPSHPSDADWPAQPNAGDTVHQIGKSLHEPVTWSITTPTESTCEQDRGGVVCSFDDGNTETVGRGSVAVLPEGVPTPPEDIPQYVLLPPTDTAGRAHHGIYWLPDEGLKLVVEPQASWFPPCTPDDPQDARCPWSEDYEQYPAPPDSEESTTLAWTVETDTDEDQNRCQVRVTWDSETVVVVLLTEQSFEQLHTTDIPEEILEGLQSLQDQPFPTPDALWKAVTARITHDDLAQYHDQILTHVEQQKAVTTIELQPSTLCEHITGDRSGILDATATCTWTSQRMLSYQWKENGPVDEMFGYAREIPHYLCEDWGWASGAYWYLGYDCHEHPHWQQPPDPQFFELIQPGKEGFTATQLMSVTYSNCQWDDERTRNFLWCFAPGYYFYAVGGEHLLYGTMRCDEQRTSFEWKGVANCEYAKTLSQIALPDGAVELIVTP